MIVNNNCELLELLITLNHYPLKERYYGMQLLREDNVKQIQSDLENDRHLAQLAGHSLLDLCSPIMTEMEKLESCDNKSDKVTSYFCSAP